jgi:predicted DNA-binding protein (MmcQ/YjbR family)
MNDAKLVSYCAALPHAASDRKWGNTLVFSLKRKMFALFLLDKTDQPNELWCKVDDDAFLSCTDQPGIRPAPCLARAKWIAVERNAMPEAMARGLLKRAREIILMKLPKRIQHELHAKDL